MWESFGVAFNAVMPFMIYLFIGYGLVRIGWADRAFLNRLNKLTFQAIFPFMMFQNIYGVSSDGMPSAKLLVFSVVSLLTLIGLLMLIVPRIVKENPRRGVIIQGIFRSNFVLYGISLTTFVYGEERASVAGILIMVVVSLFNVSAVVVLEAFREGEKSSLGQLLMKLVKNPLLQGCVLGLIAFFLHIKLPTFLEKPVSALAGMATPLAMITLGGTLQFSSLKKNRKPICAVLVLKLVLIPIVMLCAAYALGLREVELFLVLVIYATPVATSSYPMAANMGGDGELAGQLVFVSSLVSLGTMFFFIFCLSRLGLLGL